MVWALLLQLCVAKVSDDVIGKNYIFPVKTLEIFARIVPVKLNYEYAVDRRVFKAQSLLKMTPDEMLEADPRTVL